MFKIIYVGIGTLSLCIGIVGIVVPLLPTVPFFLLSAACYTKGSDRAYRWFISMKWIGKHIENYHKGKGISVQVKIFTILFLWVSIISSMMIWSSLYIHIILIIIAISVTFHIIGLKTMKKTVS